MFNNGITLKSYSRASVPLSSVIPTIFVFHILVCTAQLHGLTSLNRINTNNVSYDNQDIYDSRNIYKVMFIMY